MKRFARGALTLAFWVAVWAALALLVNRELLLPAPWVVVRRLCELAATAAFWRITAVSIGRVLLGITAAVALGTGMAVACSVSKTADALLPAHDGRQVHAGGVVRRARARVDRARLAAGVHLAAHGAARRVEQRLHRHPLGRPRPARAGAGVRLAARTHPAADLSAERAAALSLGIGFGWKSAIAAEVLTVPRSAIGRMIYESKLYLQTTDLFAWTLAVILLSVGLERLVLRALTPRGKGGGGT